MAAGVDSRSAQENEDSAKRGHGYVLLGIPWILLGAYEDLCRIAAQIGSADSFGQLVHG